VTAAAIVKPPLSARLRALVVNAAGTDVLNCTFAPGGRFGGVGIRSHLYCANCSQGLLWHEVAEGLAAIATAEDIIQAGGALEDIRRRADAFAAGVEAASGLITNCSDIIRSAGGAAAEEDVRHG
jgi:hypothetical protein